MEGGARMRKADYIFSSTAASEDLQAIGLTKGAAWDDPADSKRRALLTDYSTVSVFTDDKWFIDKKETHMQFPALARRLKFEEIDPAIKVTVKDWTLDQLLFGRKIKGINSSLSSVRYCLRLVKGKDAHQIDRIDIMRINDALFNGKTSYATAVGKWNQLRHFFKTVDCTEQAAWMHEYVLPEVRKKKSADKLIPESVATQMDIAFMSTEIPLTYRCVYWTLRLYPNRIEEVCSMTPQALKQLSADKYLLTIPVSKTGGNFEEPEEKHFQILYTGMGKYYIDLIKEQQAYTAQTMPESDFLFVTRKVCYMRTPGTEEYRYRETGNKISAVHEKMCQNFFGKVGGRLGFYDEEGNVVNITTHKFRHNAVTDRLQSGIFTQIDVMYETGHKNTLMIRHNYSHAAPPEKPEGFRGIIADQRRMAKILQRPYAKEIHHLGVCSDSRGCENDRFACLTCGHFEADDSAIPFMVRDYKDWKSKLEKAEKIGNGSFAGYCRKCLDAYEIFFNARGIATEDKDEDQEKTDSEDAGYVCKEAGRDPGTHKIRN